MGKATRENCSKKGHQHHQHQEDDEASSTAVVVYVEYDNDINGRSSSNKEFRVYGPDLGASNIK